MGSAIILGGVGTVWAITWLCFIHDCPSKCPGLSEKEKEVFGITDQTHRHEHRHRLVGFRLITLDMSGSRGGSRSRPPPTLKNHKAIGFLAIIVWTL